MKLTIVLALMYGTAAVISSSPTSINRAADSYAPEHHAYALAAIHDQSQKTPASEDPFTARQNLYNRLSAVTGISWHWMAAIDQYERSITRAKPKARSMLGKNISVFIDQERWAGPLNPDLDDNSPASIQWFNGIGRDGDGNGTADRFSDVDLLYSLINRISAYGTDEDNLSIGLWEFYNNSRAVQRIQQFARIYEKFDRLNLFEHAFPLPLNANYSYRSTWGTGRNWGGRRTHEGVDLFAGYGVPARSTSYGIVETKGWNPYGGWRIGIRDLNNFYHYYAHLSGFEKSIEVGSTVEPGQVIGYVGSSGYGKPGTQGKFPPHLHYGVYSDQGLIEWPFDPYPMLKRWESEERKRQSRKVSK